MWVVGRLLLGPEGGKAAFVAGSVRNLTFAWAAMAGVLPDSADVVSATAMIALVGVPALLTKAFGSRKPQMVMS